MNQFSTATSRILIVENEESSIRVITDILDSAGFKDFQVVEHARNVIPVCREYRPDLVLLALQIEDTDSLALVKLIGEELAIDMYLPVLALATEITGETRGKAIAAGIKDFLSKPVDRSEFLLRLNTQLETRSLYRQMQTDGQVAERRIEARTRELEAAHLETLQRLALLAEYRDDETGQHAQRIGVLAANVARAIGWPAEEVRRIRLAAPLHDIGKVGIPDRVLTKPGKLGYAEFAIMKSHTVIGGEILAGARTAVLQMARKIALSHHERWDGNGYPQGIAGELIPMAARITALADVFDALTHARPYKEALSLDQAAKIISEERGRHFDPALVNAFLALLKTQGPEKLIAELNERSLTRQETGFSAA